MAVKRVDDVTYATRAMSIDRIIAIGIDFVGSFASSPVVAMMSKPTKA